MQALMASGEEGLVRRFTSAIGDIGLQVETVSETGSALRLLTTRRFEALLLDCDLEGGLDLLELARQNPSSSRTLILACATDPATARQASRMGANFVLPKPINWEMAKRTLRAAQTMVIRERRHNFREKIHAPATLSFAQRSVQAILADISGTGVALKTDADPSVGQQARIEFTLPSGKSIESTCKVVWVRGGMVGLQFLYLSPSCAETIMRWLARHSPRARAAGL